MKNIVIAGSRGQVGRALQRSLASLGPVFSLSRKDCDLKNPDSIRTCFRTFRPDIFVNAAAYTAVDLAESEKREAFLINGDALGIIGEEARAQNSFVVHYSTDYVFDGGKAGPYLEEDEVGPLNVYGKSKLEGEKNLERACPQSLIFRTSWVYSLLGHNFVNTMLRLCQKRDELKIVADQIGAPTSANLIADVTARILTPKELPQGLFHLTASGSCSWYELACFVIEKARERGLGVQVDASRIHPILTQSYPTPALRPLNSCLSTEKLRKEFDLALPRWDQDPSLEELISLYLLHQKG